MIRITDESKNLDLTAKFELGQEVVAVNPRGYNEGVINKISTNSNEKGTIFVYDVEFYVGKKAVPKIKKCLEKHLFQTRAEALDFLKERELNKVLPGQSEVTD